MPLVTAPSKFGGTEIVVVRVEAVVAKVEELVGVV
jgi:hypothetical protein